MNIKQILFPAITVFIFISNTGIATAESGVTFPPTNTLQDYKFPPQAPVAPRLGQMPKSPAPYVFGQNNNQPRLMPQPRQMPNYQRFPAQRPVMPTRNYQAVQPRNFNRNNTGFPYSNNMMPFGNNNGFNPFSGGMPFGNNSSNSFNPFSGNSFNNPMNSMFGNNNGQLPFFKNSHKTRKKAWGTERNIWPDFYTDFTDDAWDTVMSGPRDLGEMPGGWRFPYISMPDPVTVSDAITNQFPPIAEEAGNMADFSDWGIFDNK